MDAEPPFGEAVRRALLLSTCPVSFWDIVERRDTEGMIPFAVAPLWRILPYGIAALALLLAVLYVGHLARSRDAALAGQAATMQALGVETAAKQALVGALAASNAALAEREAAGRALEHRARHDRGQLETTLAAPDARPWADARVPADVLARLRAAAADGDDGRDGDAAGVTARGDPAARARR